MKKSGLLNKIYIPLLLCGILAVSSILTSCDKKIDATLEWRMDNEKRFEEYSIKKDFKKVTIDGLNPFVYMHWIKKGEGKEYPIQTSRVLVHYECFLLAGNKSFVDGNFDQEKSLRLVLDRGKEGQSIVGVQIALQNMVVGDETEVIIPWYLAYGDKAKDSLRPYSALRYRIRLDKIIPEEELH